MKIKLIVAFILWACIYQNTMAQPYIDLINIKYHYLPAKINHQNEDENVTTNWFTASMDLPIRMKEDIFLIRPYFETYKLEGAGSVNSQLYGIGLPLSFQKQWKNKSWKTSITIIPRLNSDLENISSRDYQLGGAVLATYKKNEKLKYKFGAYYNSEFFGTLMFPLAGIDYQINDRINLFGIIPVNMTFEYRFAKNFYSGISIPFITNSYRLYDDSYFTVHDNHLKLFVDYYLTKNFVLNAEAGYSIFRKYSAGTKNEEGKNETDLEYTDGLVLKAGIAWRIRLDEKKD